MSEHKGCCSWGSRRRYRVRRLTQEQIDELEKGDGFYYVTQERAFAPGIADGWPEVIPAPHTKNGRLVRRTVAEREARRD